MNLSLEAPAVNCYFVSAVAKSIQIGYEQYSRDDITMRFNLSVKFFVAAFALTVFCSLTSFAQINFGKPKEKPPLDNPYTVNVAREQITKEIQDILKTCNVEIDNERTKVEKGRFVTKTWQFTRGVNAKPDLEYVSNLPAGDARNWLKGRYVLEINILPLDEKRSQLQIISYIQGQIAEMAGTKWIDCPSNGRLEDETLRGIAGKILGLDLSLKGNGKRRLMNCEY